MVVGAARLKSIDEPRSASAKTRSVPPTSDRSLHGSAKIILVAACIVAIVWFILQALDYHERAFGDGAKAADKFLQELDQKRNR